MAVHNSVRKLLVCLLSTCGIAAYAEPSSETLGKVQSQVFKIVSERASGTVQVGSAVLVATGKLVTNCHVLTWAKNIQIVRNGERWNARLTAADREHDLCIVTALAFPFAPDIAQAGGAAEIGQEVHAAGYPAGGDFAISCGKVRALHDYNDAKVIQTSATFSPGASGGGLFDGAGNLLGILTFRAPSGGDFHFVMPVGWVTALLAQIDDSIARPTGDAAFYQRSYSQQPYFLQAAALEETQNWPALLTIAQRWTDQSANNPESWMAVGKACVALNKKDEALSAFRRVLSIDSRHSLGRDWLNTLDPPARCAAIDCLSGDDFLAFAEPVLP
jgi:serine protease Do